MPAEAAAKQKDIECYQKLQSATGAEFDKGYIQEMVKDHEKAIALFEAAQSLADAELKAFATKTLPTLRKHHEHVQGLPKITNWTRLLMSRPRGIRQNHPERFSGDEMTLASPMGDASVLFKAMYYMGRRGRACCWRYVNLGRT